MPFDYKKEYKEFYLPKDKPEIRDIPAMNFIAVRGEGDPNQEDGAYKAAIGLLYGIAFTIKMSGKAGREMDGYFDYVVPPLEGLWWQEDRQGIDYAHKEAFRWISLIRLPDFVTRTDFDWAVEEASRKKKADFSPVEFLSLTEGLCVQCLHVGPYDAETAAMERMMAFAGEQGLRPSDDPARRHHEIYLGDPRRVPPEKWRTILRLPVERG